VLPIMRRQDSVFRKELLKHSVLLCICFAVLRMEPRASFLQDKTSNTESHASSESHILIMEEREL
jgi:hypothetical protein